MTKPPPVDQPLPSRKPRGPYKLTPERIAEVLRRADAGEPLTVIAASMGLHRNTIYRRVSAPRFAKEDAT